MSKQIGDYALIGDCETAALVGRDGSIDWLCWPSFGGEACFAALLGAAENGRWRMAPPGEAKVKRQYQRDTFILETRFETADDAATLIDFMPLREGENSSIVRIVVGERGRLPMRMDLDLRFDYGRLIPWASKSAPDIMQFVCGPHAATLRGDVETTCVHGGCHADFDIAAGERKAFVLQYRRSHRPAPQKSDPEKDLDATEQAWRNWAARCTYDGPYKNAVMRSLLTIKALTSRETGGIVAAPTTSLPEKIGGQRNWDYRISLAARRHLYPAGAAAQRLPRGGERNGATGSCAPSPACRAKCSRSTALPASTACRNGRWIGLAAFAARSPCAPAMPLISSFSSTSTARCWTRCTRRASRASRPEDWAWELQRELIEQVERIWQRARRRHLGSPPRPRAFHPFPRRWLGWRVDRAVRAAEKYELDWPLDALAQAARRDPPGRLRQRLRREARRLRAQLRDREPDGANLLLPIVGFLPADDPKMQTTVALTERQLMEDGFVLRYDTEKTEDGMPEGEGAFLACSFWYVDNLVMQGRKDEARAHVRATFVAAATTSACCRRNTTPVKRRTAGQFPAGAVASRADQSAHNLAQAHGPAHARSDGNKKARKKSS